MMCQNEISKHHNNMSVWKTKYRNQNKYPCVLPSQDLTLASY